LLCCFQKGDRALLQRYFIRPSTVDRIRASWIGDAIERYVAWLTERNYAARNVFVRVPILVRFGEFAQASGASNWDELPTHVESFVEDWLKARGLWHSESDRQVAARVVRNPIQQLLRLILPQHTHNSPVQPDPFVDSVPGFFDFLRRERGLREETVVQYRHYLQRLQDYLVTVGCPLLPDLSLVTISAFIAESGKVIDKRSVQSLCSILKTFFRYLYRVDLMTHDLSKAIESPARYRFANLPRSIAWSEVEKMLTNVDRRSAVGKRDYAILLLLVTYGLRAREVAALTLEDVDWKRDRLHIRARKAGHSTIYPLAPAAGEALLDYLQHGRPKTTERALFFRAFAPFTQMSRVAVSLRAKYHLRKAGINVARPGSHTLRHTCVQRLVDSGLSLKTIGDFVGHRTPDATKIYAKVNISALREVALGDGEEIL
jgi:integrase/recombinase XerD